MGRGADGATAGAGTGAPNDANTEYAEEDDDDDGPAETGVVEEDDDMEVEEPELMRPVEVGEAERTGGAGGDMATGVMERAEEDGAGSVGGEPRSRKEEGGDAGSRSAGTETAGASEVDVGTGMDV